MKKCAAIWVMLMMLAGAGSSAKAQDISSYFKDTVGAFVLYDMKRDRYIRHNEARCRTRFSPKSTFKIPNSLIGLETNVIRDADFVIGWNRAKYPPQPNWNQEPFIHWGRDHTLRSAFKHSVVWYYRELALRVGEERMKRHVAALDYGNEQVSGAVNDFWLNDSLKISADEQVEFLKRFYDGRLPVSSGAVNIVKEILVTEQTPEYKLSAKTGGGSVGADVYIGWYVGYLETKGNVYFFATNVEGASFADIRKRHVEVTRRVLTGLGLLPKVKP